MPLRPKYIYTYTYTYRYLPVWVGAVKRLIEIAHGLRVVSGRVIYICIYVHPHTSTYAFI